MSDGLELVARDISVQFEGLKALSNVTLTVPRGRIAGLIGPNGAGKTTLINVLTGFQPVGAGTVELEGETLSGIAAHKLRRKGVARTFQSGRLFRDLPVIDNLEVTGVGLGQSRPEAIGEAERVMAWLGISHLSNTIAGALPIPTSAASRSAAPSCAHRAICCSTNRRQECRSMRVANLPPSSGGSPASSMSGCC
ncbi:ATP-binding cassette domain-containing protein [Bradyrhizobium brasilense]|uniref:ATP-binding cassette domain-containing protein n=1 Tax=Bradyrhizobium brasilense TaxID=1419277 RepID=UPI0024B0C1F2|nr:ATP-binding cassette domain-containing protein [Bradyrhizobium australafricanum]WFU30110.1 ATP-binding cassette domain-containing protein [Bradyrhizobium australafricanum]